MSFATTRNSNRERALTLLAAVAMLLSLMVVVAKPAFAHLGTVTWGCSGWSVDLESYIEGADISITVDGGTPITASDWEDYSNSGSWDDSQSHTLLIEVDAYDDDDQPLYVFTSSGSFSPDWQNGEWSFTLDISTDDCVPDTEETTFSIGGGCEVVQGAASFTISGELGDGLTLEVAGETVDEAGPFTIDAGAAGDFPYEVTVDEGFELSEGAPAAEGVISIEDCTPPPPPSGWACVDNEVVFIDDASEFEGTLYETEEEAAADPDCTEVFAGIVVTVSGECAILESGPTGVIEVTMSVAGGADVVIRDSGGAVVGSVSDDGTVTVTPGQTYTWEATPNEGFEFSEGAATSGTISIDTCDEVEASILVTVSGRCDVVDGDGVGRISVSMSVAGGATVVVRDSNGNVEGELTDDGTISVDEGASYTWEATPSEGFEFPAGFADSGSVTIETCSSPETLPFTGPPSGLMALLGAALVGAGLLVLRKAPLEEDA